MSPNRKNKTRKAQSILEYAMVIFVVVAALLAMQVYMKRGLQGGFRASADNLGEQYAPENTTSDMTLEMHSNSTSETDTVEEGENLKTTTTVTINSDVTDRSGWEKVGALESELFQ